LEYKIRWGDETTTAINKAASFAVLEYKKTLLVDADPQANEYTTGVGFDLHNVTSSLYMTA